MAEPPSKRFRPADAHAARDSRGSRDHQSRPRSEREDQDRDRPGQRNRDRNQERERHGEYDEYGNEQDRKYRDRSDRDRSDRDRSNRDRSDRDRSDRDRSDRDRSDRDRSDRDRSDRDRSDYGNRRREHETTDGRGRLDDSRDRGERRGHRQEDDGFREQDGRRRGESFRPGTDGHRDRKRTRDDSPAKRRSRSPGREEEGPRSRRPPTSSRDTLEEEARTAVQRTLTPPVQFNLRSGNSDAHSKDRGASDGMDVDAATRRDGAHHKEPSRSNKIQTKRDIGKSEDAGPESDDDDDVVVAEEDAAMMDMQAMMGFGGFGTTKQKKVAGNDVSAVRKEKKTEYRQYMNRVGGFNRPLSPSRE